MSLKKYSITSLIILLISIPLFAFCQNITIGSTKQEVLEILGAPTTMGTYSWYYGSSYIAFSNGRVTGYRQGNVDLKISFNVPYNPDAPDYITIGSSKNDVIRVLGKPTSYGTYSWYYGSSYIAFSNGRVIGYRYGNRELKIKLIPSISGSTTKPIGVDIGSTKDEVLMVLGKPTSYGTYSWYYGSSYIAFSNGRVTGYRQGNVDLKIRISPNNQYLNVSDSYGFTEKTYTYGGKTYSISEEEGQYSISVSPTSEVSDEAIKYGSTKSLKKYKVKDYHGSHHSFVAENNSYYGQISELTGRPKTVYVKGYFRKDGTYVRSHYRSKPK